MKIVWLVSNICQIGGVEKVVIQLSNYLVEAGYNVEIVSLFSQSGDNTHFELDERVHRLDYAQVDFSYVNHVRQVRRILKQSDGDVILGTQEAINAALIINKRCFKGKIVITQHTMNGYYTKKHFGWNCRLFKRADAFIVLNQSDADEYRERGLKNCFAIPNALQTFPEEIIDINNKQVVAVGRLEKVKGFDLLITAFAKVHKVCPDWTLKIVGDGLERKALESLIEYNDLKKCVFLPGFSSNVKEELLSASVFALSSNAEGFPMALLEAMSLGLPVVSVELPATIDVLKGDNGFLVKNRDVDHFSDSIIKLIQSKDDRQMYSLKSKERARDYLIEEVGAQWCDLFEKITYSKNGRK